MRLITYWNNKLRELVSNFISTHEGVAAFVYSSFDLFSKLLDDPSQYGFNTSDVRKKGGEIWRDHIHPTTRVHEEIARDLVRFLRELSATYNGGPGEVDQVSKLHPRSRLLSIYRRWLCF